MPEVCGPFSFPARWLGWARNGEMSMDFGTRSIALALVITATAAFGCTKEQEPGEEGTFEETTSGDEEWGEQDPSPSDDGSGIGVGEGIGAGPDAASMMEDEDLAPRPKDEY